MAQLVPIEQAAMNALAAWIYAHPIFADAVAAGLQVESRWPDPSKDLPATAISVIPVGRRKETPFGSSENTVISQTNLTSLTASYGFLAKFCQQDLQLDIWATDGPTRDDLEARLDIAVNAGLAGIAATNASPVDSGVLLALRSADGWGLSAADFLLEEPLRIDGDYAESQYRTSYHGDVWCNLTITATATRLVQAILKERLREFSVGQIQAAVPPIPYGTCTVNNDGSITFAL